MPFGILAPSDHYFLQQNHIKWMVQDTITAEEEKCNAYYHFVNQTHHGLLIYYVFFCHIFVISSSGEPPSIFPSSKLLNSIQIKTQKVD